MKDFDKVNQDKTELHALKQIEKKSLFIGSVNLQAGHQCFEINNETKEVAPAQFQTKIHFNKPNTYEIIQKENHSYINALNKKNALKIFNKGGRPYNPFEKSPLKLY